MEVSPISERQPASADELVEFIARSATDYQQRFGRGINGSVLAVRVREEYPDLDYSKLGLSRLGDAVRLGVAKQLFQRNEAVKHLEICPVPVVHPEPAAASSPLTSPDVLFVKPALWQAAILVPDGAPTLFNRLTGNPVSIKPGEIDPANDPTLVQIEQVTEAQQLGWLGEFLKSKGLRVADNEQRSLTALLHGRIRDFGPAITQDWRAFRSRKAVEHIRQWAGAHGIPESMVLLPASKEAKRQRAVDQTAPAHAVVGAAAPNVPPHSRGSDEAAFRRAVQAAIAELPDSELDDVWLPLRVIRRHFQVK